MLLKDFAQRLKRKNVPIPDIYFTLLDAVSITPDLVVKSHAQGEKKGAWIHFKKLQSLYTQGFAAYGSVRNLAKAAKLFPSKVREILHSKTYTRFTQATRNFIGMRAFARFINDFGCMNLTYVDRLAKTIMV